MVKTGISPIDFPFSRSDDYVAKQAGYYSLFVALFVAIDNDKGLVRYDQPFFGPYNKDGHQSKTSYKMKSFSLFISLLTYFALTSFHSDDKGPITIYLIGDSTMADKPHPETNPERGWGQLLPEFFINQKVVVQNHAVNGRSSRSFIEEGRWDTVLKTLKKGDYVIIQFGHNDQKQNDPKRYTNPFTAYRNNLQRFVRETRSKGANPVLASSIVRRHFNEYGTLIDSHGLYPWVTREVALEQKVPFLDLQLHTEQILEQLGPEQSKSLFVWIEPGEYAMYPEGKQDNTHLNISGARQVAKMAVDEMKRQKLNLVNYVKDLRED